MTDSKEPAGGVLHRALSQRTGLIAISQRDPLDALKNLEHIAEEQLDEDVKGSSVAALSSFLTSREYRESKHRIAPTPKPDFGGDVHDAAGLSENADPDEEHDPPPLRGLVSTHGFSGGSSKDSPKAAAAMEAAEPQWKPNMSLNLGDFDQDSVSFLAEGAMCQCFLAREIPSSMNLPEVDEGEEGDGGADVDVEAEANAAAFKAARSSGVVIKTSSEGPQQAASENDLKVEAIVLRELSHPHIVRILGGGETDRGLSFICLENLSGGTLRNRLNKCGGGLGLGPGIKYGMQLASALSYMHDGGYLPGVIVMHRDLKPDNIGFAPNGDAKLMDFGLAKVIIRKRRGRSLKYVMTGETGSPRYMPPEVATSQPYNEKADVWSFIIILWEMVSGRLPFAGKSFDMYVTSVCEAGERPVIQNQWPKDFKHLLQSSWEKDPDKRPSFREIHAVLSGMHSEMSQPKKSFGLFSWK